MPKVSIRKLQQNKVLVRRFTEQDAQIYSMLLKSHNRPETAPAELTWLVEDIAAASLLRCEAGFGIFDSLITNPAYSGTARHEALNILVDHIIKYSESIGIKQLMAFSKNADVIERAQSVGFKPVPLQILVRGKSCLL